MVAPESGREEHIDLPIGEWSLWMRPIAAPRQVAPHNELHPGPIDPLRAARHDRLTGCGPASDWNPSPRNSQSKAVPQALETGHPTEGGRALHFLALDF